MKRKTDLPSPEEMDAIMLATYGMDLASFAKLDMRTQVEMAYANGVEFAGNIAIQGEDGKAITSAKRRDVTRH